MTPISTIHQVLRREMSVRGKKKQNSSDDNEWQEVARTLNSGYWREPANDQPHDDSTRYMQYNQPVLPMQKIEQDEQHGSLAGGITTCLASYRIPIRCSTSTVEWINEKMAGEMNETRQGSTGPSPCKMGTRIAAGHYTFICHCSTLKLAQIVQIRGNELQKTARRRDGQGRCVVFAFLQGVCSSQLKASRTAHIEISNNPYLDTQFPFCKHASIPVQRMTTYHGAICRKSLWPNGHF